MSYHKKNLSQEEPRCVICSVGFYFRDPLNPYGAKCPHILLCGHSACEGCLSSALSKNNALVCPVCTTVSEAKKFSDPKNLKKSEMLSLREEFPLNVYALGQISLKRNKMNSGENFIKFCPKNKKMTDRNAAFCNECNDRTADCSCRQCGTELCSSCFSAIHNSVTLRKHEQISLKELAATDLFIENRCEKHKSRYRNILCKDCNVYMCKECAIEENHLEHRCTDVFQQNEDKLSEFSELFDEANEVLKQLYATKKKLQQSGTRGQVLDEEAQKVERQVQVHFNYLHGMLQRQEEELLKKIRSVNEAARMSLESVVTDLDKNIKEVENMLSLSNCTITSNKVKEIPLDLLLEKLRNITGTPCYLVLNDEEVYKFEVHIDPTITDQLSEHCTVEVPSKRVFELRSRDELPESYKVESLQNIPDPFLKPDINVLKASKEKDGKTGVQTALINAISPKSSPTQTEAKTKPHDFQRRNNPGPRQREHKNSLSGSVISLSSQESWVERITSKQPLQEGTSDIVIMSHLLSPNSFYVQRKCNVGEIEKIREYFSKNANRSKYPPSEIEYGQMYLVHYSQDNSWYRGRVLRVDGQNCDIFYVDYGNTEKKVPKKMLRDIPERYAVIPDQALHCGLYSCTPANGEWTNEANKLITSMAYRKDLSMYVERINHAKAFHEVHLRCADDKAGSFTDALIYSGYATRTESTVKEEGLFKQSAFGMRRNTFKNTVIKEHEVFDGQVTHINTPSHFYIQKITDGGELMMKLMSDLSETYSRYGDNQGLVFTPTIGMSVAARFQNDGSWYRAMVLCIPEPRKVQVKYVDFGNVAVVGIEDIRELQAKFLRIGAQALKCSLADIAPKHAKGWPTSAKTAFEKLVLNKGLLRVYVEEVKKDNELSIVLYETTPTKYINISGVLVNRRHAHSTGQTSAQAQYACRPEYEKKPEHRELPMSDSESVYSEVSQPSKVSSGNSKNQVIVNRAAERFGEEPTAAGGSADSGEVQGKLDQNIDGRVKIEVLKIMSPSEIYVTTGTTTKLIKKLIKEMTLFYNSAELEDRKEDVEWSVGDLCAVLKLDDKQWYRGVITELSHTNYKVYIKDVVEVVDVDASMLQRLEPQFCDTPDGSTKVHLGGLRVPAALKSWPASTSDFLRRFTEEAEALYIEKLGGVVNDSIPVRLWRRRLKMAGPLDPIEDEWCDVNESLVTLGFALLDQAADDLVHTPVEPNNIEINNKYIMSWLDNSFQVAAEAPYVSDLERDDALSVRTTHSASGRSRSRSNRGRFPSQRACYIPAMIGPEGPEVVTEWKPAVPFKSPHFFGQPTYVDYDCNIYIQDIDSCASTLELLEKAFLSLFENSEKRPYEEEYIEGQICVAFFQPNKKWYRGKVLKVKPEHIEVLFVDYGNVEELQPEELRKQVTMGHIPIQCHKCRTEGIIPISRDGKWPVQALDFIHGAVVEQRCEINLKEPNDSCQDYVILSLRLPGGQDLLETLLSMHYATYVLDCEKVGGEDEDEEIIVDQEIQLDIQLAISNNKDSKALAKEIQDRCSNFGSFSLKDTKLYENKEELIEDHVRSLQLSEKSFDWYEMAENQENEHLQAPKSPGFISELDTTPRMELRYRDMLLPDSMVEFTVEVQIVCSYNSLKVMISECDDPEIMAYINEFNKLQMLIQEEAYDQPTLSSPEKDLVCIGCYTGDDTWYRAVIKKVFPNNEAKVYYVDYGNVEDIPLTRLRTIKPEWTLMPVQAVQVTLHNVREGPYYEKHSCHEAYRTCFMNPPYTMTIESRFPSLQVELYNGDGELAYKPLLDAGLISKD